MYCYLANLECYHPTCIGCSYTSPNNQGYYHTQEFNCGCPNCKGKFNTPITKQNLVDCDICGNGGYWKSYYVCPFCNRKMEGLK